MICKVFFSFRFPHRHRHDPKTGVSVETNDTDPGITTSLVKTSMYVLDSADAEDLLVCLVAKQQQSS